LLQDLKKGDNLNVPEIDHLVVSGDFTDKGSPEGFAIAREFLSRLRLELDISIQQCVFVPGNHDVHDETSWYEGRDRVDGVPDHDWARQGEVYLVRNNEKYGGRLASFSNQLFHKLVQKPYPDAEREQGIAYTQAETCIQFLTLNSCWQIGRFHRKQSAIHPEAVAHVIEDAENQLVTLIDRGDIESDANMLRIGVWHHALAHAEMIRDQQFVGHLKNAGVKVALCGDVHEMNCEVIHNFYRRQLNVVGVGSFGSPHDGLPPSTPRHYNVLEIRCDSTGKRFTTVRVHTRQQKQPDGPWEPFCDWPRADREPGRLPYFDIELT
jgi:hypothetical protein